MTGAVASPVSFDVAYEDQVLKKVFRRLMPFLFVLMVIAYLDRVNIGFAALSMNKELRLTATMYGLANSIFYAGYAACEIPSNMALAKFGARRWIGRILITWGIAASACMFVAGAHSLYTLRLLLGIAEAGFMPGILLYLTYWFPPTFRARATALFLLAQPLTLAVGSSVSGVILDHSQGWLGLAGWRWLYFIEGSPAILLGIVTLFYLSDRPQTARWLSDVEKDAILRRLQREQVARPARPKVLRELFSRNLLMVAAMYFGMVTSLGTMAAWVPQIVREMVQGRTLSSVGILTAVPPVCALVCMHLWGVHSDKKLERRQHCFLGILVGIIGWTLVIAFKDPQIRMLGLIFCYVGVFSALVILWALTPHLISPESRPVAMGFVGTCGNASSIVQMSIVGVLRDLTHSWAAGLIYVLAMLVMSAVFALMIRESEKAPALVSAGKANT